jgi:WD40 repeat protein
VAVSSNDNTFYAAGADGRIFKADILSGSIEPTLIENRFPNRTLALSKDDRYLITAGDSSFVQLHDLQEGKNKPVVVRLGNSVHDAETLPNNQGFLVSTSDALWIVNFSGAAKKLLSTPSAIRSLDINKAGTLAVGGSWSGSVFLIDLTKNTIESITHDANTRVMAVKFHPSDTLLGFGLEDKTTKRGLVKFYDLETRQVTRQFAGHKAAVNDIEFSPDGELLASAGADKRLQMWVIRNPEDLPVVMDNNDGFIWDIAFAKGSDYLITTTYESEIRIWPTDPAILQNEICNKLEKNMTRYEWETYVGKDIKHEITCIGLLIEDY